MRDFEVHTTFAGLARIQGEQILAGENKILGLERAEWVVALIRSPINYVCL